MNLVDKKIPKILWQTAKDTQNLHAEAKKSTASFLVKNPDYQWYIMDDDQCWQFIQDHFDLEFCEMYRSLPIGVMKADIWRMAVVYVYGGIYLDTDCDCVIPLDNWIMPDDQLIVFEEHANGVYGNFVIIAEPRHPALLYGLNIAVEYYNSPEFLNSTTTTPVQDFGANAYYAGVRKFIKDNPDRPVRVLKFEDSLIGNCPDKKAYILHNVASLRWRGYDSWRRIQKLQYGKFK